MFKKKNLKLPYFLLDYREKIKMCFFEFLRMLYFVFFKGVHARKDFITMALLIYIIPYFNL